MNVRPVQAQMASSLILSPQTDHPLEHQLNKIKPISETVYYETQSAVWASTPHTHIYCL